MQPAANRVCPVHKHRPSSPVNNALYNVIVMNTVLYTIIVINTVLHNIIVMNTSVQSHSLTLIYSVAGYEHIYNRSISAYCSVRSQNLWTLFCTISQYMNTVLHNLTVYEHFCTISPFMNTVLHNLTIYEHFYIIAPFMSTVLHNLTIFNTFLHNLTTYEHCSAHTHSLWTLFCTISHFLPLRFGVSFRS